MTLVDPDDIAALARVRQICLGFPNAEEGQLQDRQLFRVGRRRFALFNGATSPASPRWNASGRSLHFLADADELVALRQDPRFAPSPHHGDRRWLMIRLDHAGVDWQELAELLESAYRNVASSRR